MSADPNKKSARSFQCRDVLWETFEQMARELECSVDYLINEAMKQYARQRSYGAGRAHVAITGSRGAGERRSRGRAARADISEHRARGADQPRAAAAAPPGRGPLVQAAASSSCARRRHGGSSSAAAAGLSRRPAPPRAAAARAPDAWRARLDRGCDSRSNARRRRRQPRAHRRHLPRQATPLPPPPHRSRYRTADSAPPRQARR